jgi:hypothetical protein
LLLDYFPEVCQICKVLIKLIPKDYVKDLMFLPEIIQEAAGAAAVVVIHHNTVNIIFDANK